MVNEPKVLDHIQGRRRERHRVRADKDESDLGNSIKELEETEPKHSEWYDRLVHVGEKGGQVELL